MRFYKNELPQINELVLVTFNNKTSNFFEGDLLEYECPCFMNFSDTSKKKRIISWNKILQLNKNIIAKVLNINKNIIQVSILYLNEHIAENNDDKLTKKKYNVQEKLMEFFNNNKKLYNFIQSFCIINKYNFENLWTTLIYRIDELRIKNKYKNSLWEYFTENITRLNEIFIDISIDIDIINSLCLYYNDKKKTSLKIISRFGLISNDGIEITKKILNTINKNKLKIYYDASSYYILETNSNSFTELNHLNFFDDLKKLIHMEYPNTYLDINILATIL